MTVDLLRLHEKSFCRWVYLYIADYFASLAMALLLTGHVIWSVAFGSLALKGPKLIQDYLFANQGSGFAGKLQVASNIRRIFAH